LVRTRYAYLSRFKITTFLLLLKKFLQEVVLLLVVILLLKYSSKYFLYYCQFAWFSRYIKPFSKVQVSGKFANNVLLQNTNYSTSRILSIILLKLSGIFVHLSNHVDNIVFPIEALKP